MPDKTPVAPLSPIQALREAIAYVVGARVAYCGGGQVFCPQIDVPTISRWREAAAAATAGNEPPAANQAPDLSLIDTQTIIHELLNRSDHGVIALMQVHAKSDGSNIYRRSVKGNSHTCIGLCFDMQDNILQELRGSEKCLQPPSQPTK